MNRKNETGTERYDLAHPQVSEKVSARLAEFTAYARMNPDRLVDLILTQWMDNQLALYQDLWNLDQNGDKYLRMSGMKK